jgi:dihydrofolate reductase
VLRWPPSGCSPGLGRVERELVNYLRGGQLPQPMRRVIVDALISLDGYLSDANGEIDWFTQEEDFLKAEGKAWSLEMLRRADTILFGRVTFDGMAEWWPSETARRDMPEIAQQLNGTAKIVFSRTLKTTAWENTTILPEPSKKVILELKQRPGRDMLILASSSLVSSLMRDDLIDEYWIRVVPVVLGSGRPLFKDQKERHKLRLVSCQAFKSGVVAVRYEPKG